MNMGRNTPARKTPDKLSRDPRAVRARLRKGTNVERDLAILAESGHMKPVEEWDVEELAKGRPRGKDGKFAGKAPPWLTEAVTREARRRLLTHTLGEIGSHVDTAVETIVEIMKDTEEKASVRLQAATYILDHVVGKAPAKVEVDLSATEQARTTLNAILMTEDEDGNLVPKYPVVDLDEDEWEEGEVDG